MGLFVTTTKLASRAVSSAMNASAPGIMCSSWTSTPSMSIRYDQFVGIWVSVTPTMIPCGRATHTHRAWNRTYRTAEKGR